MNNQNIILIVLMTLGMQNFLYAQSFPHGTNAIHKDSSIIVGWATKVDVVRGYIDISDTSRTYTEAGYTSNRAWFGEPENAIGKANGQFVSFGDAGYAIVEFDKPISNGPGPDFAVFENAMFSPPGQYEINFVELAFVEVSSDGVNYERFPSVSNMQTERQIGSFESVDYTLYHNFAGIYPVFYGVPFDLDDIQGEVVDKNNITHIKIIDAVGCINPEYARYDSKGNIVNFAWPTPFWQGGFDLDAVAVINNESLNVESSNKHSYSIYPNPARDYVIIEGTTDLTNIYITDMKSRILNKISIQQKSGKSVRLDLSDYKPGVYIINIVGDNNIFNKKIIKLD